jgi:hypothetical protein
MALGILLALSAGALAQDNRPASGEEDRKVLKVLSQKKVSLRFAGAPLWEVVGFLRQISGVKTNLHWKARNELRSDKRTVTAKFTDLPFLKALEAVCSAFDLAWSVTRGKLEISPQGVFSAPTEKVFYDLSRLTRPGLRNPGRVRDLFRAYYPEDHGQPEFEDDEYYTSITVEDVETVIRDSIAPESWDEPDYGITVVYGNLLVQHCAAVQSEIRKLLAELEEGIGPAIHYSLRVWRVPVPVLGALSSGGALSDADLDLLEKGSAGILQPFGEYRISCLNEERTHLVAGRDFSFVSRMAGGYRYYKEARDGVLVDLQPLYAGGDTVPTVVRVFLSRADRAEGRLPSMPFLRLETVVEVPMDRPALVSAGSVPLGKDDATCLVLALRAGAERRPKSVESAPPERPGDRAIAEMMAKMNVSADYLDTPLSEVLLTLADRHGLSVLISPDVFEEKSEDELMVQLKVDAIPLSQMLNLVLRMRNLTYMIQGGVIRICTLWEITDPQTVFRRMGLHDLVGHPHTAFHPARLYLPRRPGAPPEFDEDESEGLCSESIENLIRENVHPDSWDTPPNQLTTRSNMLLARNRRPILDEIEKLLGSLRSRIWEDVRLEGTFFRVSGKKDGAPAPAFPGAGLTGADCEKLTAALAGKEIKILGRFVHRGILTSDLWIAGGRQVVRIREGQSEKDFGTEPVLDGWIFNGSAAAGVKKGSVGLVIRAARLRYDEPENPFARAGDLSVQVFEGRCELVRDAGVVLGGGSGTTGREENVFLFLRLR